MNESTNSNNNLPQGVLTEPVPVEKQPHQLNHKKWLETYELDVNEKALLLIERNELEPENREWRRYQTIFVVRRDQLAKYMEDMGSAVAFTSSPIVIPGGDPSDPTAEWAMTVGEIKAHANELRQDLMYREIERAMPDFESGYHDLIDQEARALNHQSQFGPKYKVERA